MSLDLNLIKNLSIIEKNNFEMTVKDSLPLPSVLITLTLDYGVDKNEILARVEVSAMAVLTRTLHQNLKYQLNFNPKSEFNFSVAARTADQMMLLHENFNSKYPNNVATDSLIESANNEIQDLLETLLTKKLWMLLFLMDWVSVSISPNDRNLPKDPPPPGFSGGQLCSA